jgi:histidyl-tRNA synthetase
VQRQLTDAPLLVDSIGAAARTHYDAVRGHLSDLGVVWEEAPRLVRGLDYYTRTTFEFVHDGLGAQSAVGGGGRYDGLSEAIGGPPLPSVGFALGVDRTLLALAAEGIDGVAPARCAVFGVGLGDAAHRELVRLVTGLRRAGVVTDLAPRGRGLKGAMKAADRSGASFALILGDRDLSTGSVQLKNLATGDQRAVALDDLIPTLQEALP